MTVVERRSFQEEVDINEDDTESNWDEEIDSFEKMGLKDNLVRGIYSYGFENPSNIQKRGIPAVLKDRDVIAQAQSGTGKTATYLIGAFQKVDPSLSTTQILIVAPTRELAWQIYDVAISLGCFMKSRVHCSTGGHRLCDDTDALVYKPCHILIATMGRLRQLFESGRISAAHINMLIIDEADEMLGRGFMEDIRNLISVLNSDVQILLFSATMPRDVIELARKFTRRDSIKILVKQDQLTLEGIRQYYVEMNNENDKFETICDIYKNYNIQCAVIFCGSKLGAMSLADKLRSYGHSVGLVHGALETREREEQVKRLSDGSVRVLVTTNLISRGIDIQKLSLVIIYDLSQNLESYLHQIGRSGRYGRKGVAIVFVLKSRINEIKRIEQHYLTTISQMPKIIPGLERNTI